MFFKKITILASFLLSAAVCFGQKVNFVVNAPGVVDMSEAFKVEFSINASYTDFVAPSFDGFEVLAGPSVAHGTSVSVSGGNVTRNEQHTITYVLQGTATGKFTIAPAELKVKGKPYSTKPAVIEVVDDPEKGRNAGQQTNGAASGSISSEDLFVSTIVDKTTVFKGEPVRVTFKIFTRGIPNTIESAKNPPFNGFWMQEINAANYQWQRENFGGRVYDARIIREVLLYPQQSGALYVEQFDANVIAQVVVKEGGRSIQEQLMGGGQEIREVRKKLSAQPVRITVLDLPAGAPRSFNGAVGSFTMSNEWPQSNIAANTGANIVAKISGTGNLPLIQFPKITLPASFEQYNTRTTESFSLTAGGISGYRQFEFPFIARAEGSFNIHPIEFSYFSPETKRYVTLTSGPFTIDVVRDSTSISGSSGGTLMSGISKEDVILIGQDIRFIKLTSGGLYGKGKILLGSWLYFMTLAGGVILFFAAYSYLRKRIQNMKNAAFVKSKRANKVALARLRTAEGLMKAGEQRGFYEEMLKALWGFMSDSLNIPVAILTKESIREELAKRPVPATDIENYIGVISECEYAQYSPDGGGHMSEVYISAIEVISQIESIFKKRLR